MEIPLFPLHSVLCPGVALPLHIFEERYRLMIARCIERGEPFGVVLIREGREAGAPPERLAEIGTTAVIRRAGRYPDGRLDIVTIGPRRFRVTSVSADREPYLVGDVTLITEESGGDAEAKGLADQVGRRFIRYLELLQPALADNGPEIEIEVEIEAPDDTSGTPEPLDIGGMMAEVEEPPPLEPVLDTKLLSEEQRRDLLMAAAHRLAASDDPTALSFLLTALIQVELATRQDLLEAPDTVGRLCGLDAVLKREIRHLSRHLRPLAVDARQLELRRN